MNNAAEIIKADLELQEKKLADLKVWGCPDNMIDEQEAVIAELNKRSERLQSDAL